MLRRRTPTEVSRTMRFPTPLLLTVPALALAATLAVAQDDGGQDDGGQEGRRTLLDLDRAEREAYLERMMRLAQPSEEHALLAGYAGTFDVTMRRWTEPDGEPTVFEGEAVHEAVLGGRFLRITSTATYEFPGVGSREVESLVYLGFDRRSERFTWYGMDTMATYALDAEGIHDGESRTLNLSGVLHDPALDVTQAYDIVVELVDEDTMKTTTIVHDALEPGPFELVEVISRRRKQ